MASDEDVELAATNLVALLAEGIDEENQELILTVSEIIDDFIDNDLELARMIFKAVTFVAANMTIELIDLDPEED